VDILVAAIAQTLQRVGLKPVRIHGTMVEFYFSPFAIRSWSWRGINYGQIFVDPIKGALIIHYRLRFTHLASMLLLLCAFFLLVLPSSQWFTIIGLFVLCYVTNFAVSYYSFKKSLASAIDRRLTMRCN